MKLAGDKANNYFSNPDANHTSILIYGADSMRVALRRQELIKSLIGDNAEEEMRLTRVSASDLRKDPALLLDGLKASGFFPGLRAVSVASSTNTARKPGKNPLAFNPSNKSAGSFLKSDPEIRVNRISSSASSPMSDLSSSCLRKATRMLSAPNIRIEV